MKIILTIIYAIICAILIVITLMQSGEEQGASATIVGGSSSNFFEKNKGRTKEGMLKKWTIILGIVFILLTIVLNIVYMM